MVSHENDDRSGEETLLKSLVDTKSVETGDVPEEKW